MMCKKCNSKNTDVVSAKKLAEKTNDNQFLTATAGVASTTLIIGAVKSIFEALGKLFGWMEEKEKNDRNVIVCKDCGYWERI